MKKFISVFALVITLCANIQSQPVQRANVYFKNNSAELTATVTALLDTIYSKLPEGNKIRIGLVGDGEDFSMTRFSDERFNSVQQYLTSKNVKPEFIRYEITASGAEAVIEKEIKLASKKFLGIDDYFVKNIQSFTINPAEENTIRGEKGTEITFPAYAFLCADGSEPGDKIRIELREFYSRGDLLKADLHTMSGSNILETGGTVHVVAFCGDEEAQLADGAQMTLAFPYKQYKEGMQTFNGFAENGMLDWVASGEGSETPVSEEDLYFDPETEQYYSNIGDVYFQTNKNEAGLDNYLLSSGSLGWINCDRFYDDPAEKMEIVVSVDTALHPSVRLVFKNIQSVMSGYPDETGKVRFEGIPQGSEVSLVAYSIVDNKPYMALKNIVVNNNSEEKMMLAETSKKWMERELLSLK
ncbi:MAG: hypothetical protein AB7G44_03160 [Bacteroidia bacterium]